MKTETKNCTQCKTSFTIEADDFAFYEKMGVSPPTLCPDDRQRRRYAWRNEKVLYRRDCDLCKKSMVTIYSKKSPYVVYCPPCWWSDSWDQYEHAREFDFSRPFFEQFQELQLKAPRIALLTKNSVNSDYTNHSADNKNCYLSFGTFTSENVMYSNNVFNGGGQDCMDCYHLEGKNSLLYQCIDTYGSYNCQYGFHLRDCNDCHYCFDVRGSSNCFLSYNLRNKQYHILNQPYSKEEYFKKLEEFKLSSSQARKEFYKQYLDLIQNKAIHRASLIEKSVNCSGNMIFNSKNTHHSFDVAEMEDTKYGTLTFDVKTSMDAYHYGIACELIYECQGITRDYNTMFAHLSYDNNNGTYIDTCQNSENLFGCVSLKKGSYCIFNKQYSKEEYQELKDKIIEHMKGTGEWGEFYPVSISPFGYNETQGQIYMPMTKEEVLALGWKWEDNMPGTYGKETIQPEEIPDDIKDVDDSILKQALKCERSGKNYNIIRPELDFYRQNNIPIPRLHPEERYKDRIAMRPDRKLYKRKCAKTDKDVLTGYAPDRPETIYCEEAYLEAVV